MNYRVRYTKGARDDLQRLFGFLLKRDAQAALRARDAIVKAAAFLHDFPFNCRKADESNPFWRELLLPYGCGGYVALFEIEEEAVTILAIRHQREEDYF